MNGPEHFAAAEQILATAPNVKDYRLFGERPASLHEDLTRAQVHATLALAAATVDAAESVVAHAPEWRAAMGAVPAAVPVTPQTAPRGPQDAIHPQDINP